MQFIEWLNWKRIAEKIIIANSVNNTQNKLNVLIVIYWAPYEKFI